MESPSLLLLDPTCEETKDIKCVGDFYQKSKNDPTKLSLAILVSEMKYFVIDGNHRWVQKRDHLKLHPSDKNNFFYKFTPAQIYIGLTKLQTGCESFYLL
jgi:hypothetical protein